MKKKKARGGECRGSVGVQHTLVVMRAVRVRLGDECVCGPAHFGSIEVVRMRAGDECVCGPTHLGSNEGSQGCLCDSFPHAERRTARD